MRRAAGSSRRAGGDQPRRPRRGRLHRHRPDGAEAVRSQGATYVYVRQLAQDEGSAMAEYAWRRGWRDAALATDTVIDYFKNVVQAFEARWRQLGGKVVAEESYQSSPTGSPDPASSQNVVNRLKDVDADVIVTATAPPWGAMNLILTVAHARREYADDQPRAGATAVTGCRRTRRSPTTTSSPMRPSSVTTRFGSPTRGRRRRRPASAATSPAQPRSTASSSRSSGRSRPRAARSRRRWRSSARSRPRRGSSRSPGTFTR